MNTRDLNKSWLSYLNLSDAYERKARFIPGLLTIMFMFPAAIALSIPLNAWITVLVAGVGLSAVFAVGLSHLASAMGNRFQERLWPCWPHDAPTHRRLHPTDTSCSKQQKQIWYAALKRLTSLDIVAVGENDPTELEAIINDAVTHVRTRLWKSPHADRLRVQNADYGFARNFAGLRPVWISTSSLAAIACWIAYYFHRASLEWSTAATTVAAAAFPLAFAVLPKYVVQKANHYADSFFDAMLALDRADSAASEGSTES